MRKTSMMLVFVMIVFGVRAQTENDLATTVARICQTDSIIETLGVYDEDSTLVFYMQTPDYNKYGAVAYEYGKFDLVFDVSSNLLFNQAPFGKVDFVEYGKKKCKVVIEIGGAGDREASKRWTFAVYDFSRSKGGPWQLQDVDYYFDDYFKGKKLK